MPAKLTGKTLSEKLALEIMRKARNEALPADFHFAKQSLAEEFGVSRSPVQSALELLAREGLVVSNPKRGFFLSAGQERIDDWLDKHEVHSRPDHPAYIILSDHINNHLPGEFSEKELARQYHLTRGQVSALLRELLQDGWIEHKAGYGWAFLPVVTSLHSSAQSYEFRQTIECAALLDKNFRPNSALYAQLRSVQEDLLNGRLYELNNAELFVIGSNFHEAIAGCSGNPFYHDALCRVNKLRRLYEHYSRIDVAKFETLSHEHLALLALLDQGDQQGAAALMHRHLGNVLTMKRTHFSHEHPGDVNSEEGILLHF